MTSWLGDGGGRGERGSGLNLPLSVPYLLIPALVRLEEMMCFMCSLLLFCWDSPLEMNLKVSYDNKLLIDVQNKLVESFAENKKKMQFRGFAILDLSITLKLTYDPIKSVSKQ